MELLNYKDGLVLKLWNFKLKLFNLQTSSIFNYNIQW